MLQKIFMYFLYKSGEINTVCLIYLVQINTCGLTP